jgi:protein involved in polysaccharide export with SLBB domain
MSTFLVLGHVNTPGLISIPEGKNTIDFLEGIGLAGGFTRLARPSKVIVKRKEGNTEEIYEVNADKLARDAGKPFLLQNGDKVTVTERFF